MQEETNKKLLKAVETLSNKLTTLQAEVKDIKCVIHMVVRIYVIAVKRKEYLSAIIALNMVVWIILDTAENDKIRETRLDCYRGAGGNQGYR